MGGRRIPPGVHTWAGRLGRAGVGINTVSALDSMRHGEWWDAAIDGAYAAGTALLMTGKGAPVGLVLIGGAFVADNWDGVTDWAGGAWETTSEAAVSAWDTASEVATDAWEAATDTATSTWEAATDTVSGTWEAAADTATSTWEPDEPVARWSVEFGRMALLLGGPDLPWVVADERGPIGEVDGELAAFDEASGEERWRVDVGELSQSLVGLAVAEGVVYVASAEEFHAVDADRGEIRWSTPLEGARTSQPVVGGDTVYIAVTDDDIGDAFPGEVHAFD